MHCYVIVCLLSHLPYSKFRADMLNLASWLYHPCNLLHCWVVRVLLLGCFIGGNLLSRCTDSQQISPSHEREAASHAAIAVDLPQPSE